MRKTLLAVLFAFSLFSFAGQSAGNAPNSNVPSQAGSLRVNSPKANERLRQNFVHVQYQLVNRGTDPATSPNFTVQLDGNDPITTTAYDYTFTGLAPGAHTVTVTLVDANGVPIANSQVSTKFTVANQNGPAPSTYLREDAKVLYAGMASFSDGTALYWLSLIGFAVLVGGICTAARAPGKKL